MPPEPPTVPVRLLLATTSAGKLRELNDLLSGLPLQLVSPPDVGAALHVEETGASFRENAVLKATAFARAAGLPALADDSGLEVDALGGEPGVRSHRYGATDADRMARLLARLQDVPEGQRTARFRCVLALATPAGLVGTAEGTCEGRIAREPRGENGFGYDPIFWLPERGRQGVRTLAELEPPEKNAISHRARAAAGARRLIQAWLLDAAPGSRA